MKVGTKVSMMLLAVSSHIGFVSPGLIHTGDGLFTLDSRDRTYIKITSTFGPISGFGI